MARINILNSIADEQKWMHDALQRDLRNASYYQELADQFGPILEKIIGQHIALYGLPFLEPDKPYAWLEERKEGDAPPLPTIEFSYGSGHLNVSIKGPREALGIVFRFLHSKGYQLPPPARRPKAGQNYWSYSFMREVDRREVYVSFSSTTCFRKKVGTKMVEQDVYETVCI